MIVSDAEMFLRTAFRNLFNSFGPRRPFVPAGAFLSTRAKIEGCARNISISSGSRIREHAWLNCMDSNSLIEIGGGTLIMPFAKLVAGFGGKIIVGKNCSIHSFDVLYGFSGGLTIGDNVRIGVHSVFVSGNHQFEDPSKGPNEQGFSSQGIEIGSGTWIGASVKILDGVKIGERAVIGAGSVVTRSMPSDYICAGVPAKPIRERWEKQ